MLFEEKLKEERKEEYEDGIEQVEINRALRVVDNLLSKGFSIEETCEIAGISAEAYLTAADQD